MSEEEYVIRRVKKVYVEEDHGGGWKIALADFMCALMIIFFTLWAINQTPSKNTAALSDYFKGKTPTSDESILLIDTAYTKVKKLIKDEGIVMSVDKNSKGITIKFDSSLLFKSGSDELKPKALKDIEKLAIATESEGLFYHVYGYTDDIPVRKGSSIKNNLILSVRRATSASEGLIEGGISPNRITIHGEGLLNPQTMDTTNKGRKENRRVELFLTYSSAPTKLYGTGVTYTKPSVIEKDWKENTIASNKDGKDVEVKEIHPIANSVSSPDTLASASLQEE
ncbi:OmpA/MotB family protein [Photobacterium kishitanii]|uniref:OmpA-like domain-containing protein n=1 Tax=Photobacterium kishitanii TaxID=318456 RepID=A0A2T3KMT3_9GAMM|nr:OmpA family protein [Photobacterium kishitanii]PSV01110.1 hypothetical protein C9J27_03565 [Photobacterium kishitanii]